MAPLSNESASNAPPSPLLNPPRILAVMRRKISPKIVTLPQRHLAMVLPFCLTAQVRNSLRAEKSAKRWRPTDTVASFDASSRSQWQGQIVGIHLSLCLVVCFVSSFLDLVRLGKVITVHKAILTQVNLFGYVSTKDTCLTPWWQQLKCIGRIKLFSCGAKGFVLLLTK